MNECIVMAMILRAASVPVVQYCIGIDSLLHKLTWHTIRYSVSMFNFAIYRMQIK